MIDPEKPIAENLEEIKVTVDKWPLSPGLIGMLKYLLRLVEVQNDYLLNLLRYDNEALADKYGEPPETDSEMRERISEEVSRRLRVKGGIENTNKKYGDMYKELGEGK